MHVLWQTDRQSTTARDDRRGRPGALADVRKNSACLRKRLAPVRKNRASAKNTSAKKYRAPPQKYTARKRRWTLHGRTWAGSSRFEIRFKWLDPSRQRCIMIDTASRRSNNRKPGSEPHDRQPAVGLVSGNVGDGDLLLGRTEFVDQLWFGQIR